MAVRQRVVARDGGEVATAAATGPREARTPDVAGAGFFEAAAEAERVTADFFAAVTPRGAAQALAGQDFVSQTAAAVAAFADFARSQA